MISDLDNKSPVTSDLSPDYRLDYESSSQIDVLVDSVLQGNASSLSSYLTDWQLGELAKVGQHKTGLECLLTHWLVTEPSLPTGSYCNATWDDVYCWPPTPAGNTVMRSCEETFQENEHIHAGYVGGNAFRICTPNASWLWGRWTNYTECADLYDEYVRHNEEERQLVVTTQYILFIGSILSLFCLTTAVSIFYYFKCLWCDRVTIHIHLMVALIIRYTLLFIITEPFVFNRASSYRSVDFVCKTVLTVYLYATVTSINWMFIQGIYINGKLTTNVFDGQTPFKVYYTIGWILPILLLLVYVVVMETRHPVRCWRGYSDMTEMWIVVGPMIFALMVNFLFFINILRVLLTKVHIRNGSGHTEAVQFRRAAKATVFLLPLLGVNNLLFVYNPGGSLHKYYVILNSLFGSTQGIFVAIVYCYLSKDVRDAFRRVYRRFMARRNANRIRRSNPRRHNRTAASGSDVLVIVEHPVNHHHNRSDRSFNSQNTNSSNATTANGLLNSPNNRSVSNLSVSPVLTSSHSQQTLVHDMCPTPTTQRSRSPSSTPSLRSLNSLGRTGAGSSGGAYLNNNNNCGPCSSGSSYRLESSNGGSMEDLPQRTQLLVQARPSGSNQYSVVSIPLKELTTSI